jgi:hypothetical protein
MSNLIKKLTNLKKGGQNELLNSKLISYLKKGGKNGMLNI